MDIHEPVVRILLTPLHQSDIEKGPREFWLPTSSQIHNSCWHILPLTYLPYLSLGAICEGYSIMRPDVSSAQADETGLALHVNRFELSVNVPNKVATIAINDRDDSRLNRIPHELLPLSFRYNQLLLTSVVWLNIQPNHVLLIPSIELIRFYVGIGSTPLVRALVNANNGLYRSRENLSDFVDPDYTNLDNQDCFVVRLRPGLAASDRYLLGRLWSGPHARRQAANIGAGMQHGSARQFLTPAVGFPFAGETILSLEGAQYQTPGGLKLTLAYRLRSCTSPFPFTSTRLARESFRAYRSNGHDRDEDEAGTTTSAEQIIGTVTDPAPRPRLPTYFEGERMADLFPDLRDKKNKPDLVIDGPEGERPFGDTPMGDVCD